MSFSLLRNRVHLAVTPQSSPAPQSGPHNVLAERPDAGRDSAAGRAVGADGPAHRTADPSLRRMVQAVPNHLR
jgi:hypothetical protein